MNLLNTIICIAALLIPSMGVAHEYHNGNYANTHRWQEGNNRTHYYYDDAYSYEKKHPKRDQKKHRHDNKKRHYANKQAQPGWDVTPRIAKKASNCYRYTLSTRGGKGSARIMSIPGRNYIQVQGNRSGYVCFQGEPTLELGKLGDPSIKVTFKLEGKGKYAFNRGQKGSSYKNHWYRSYWGL